MTDTPERVRDVIRRELGVPKCQNRDRLRDNLGADELGLVQIAMELEEEFEIDVSDQELHDCDTVSDVIDLVERKLTDV